MMAATLADGETVIENAAKEPEIVDLANYLNKMGGKVEGGGTSILRIQGVSKLHAAEHRVIPDRIEAGTLLIAGAITGGEVTVTDCRPGDLEALVVKMRESGFKVSLRRKSHSPFRRRTNGKASISQPRPIPPSLPIYKLNS